MKLYELTEAYRNITALMEEEGGVIEPVLDDQGKEIGVKLVGWKKALDDLDEEISVKLVNIAKVVREMEAEEDAYKAEAGRMAAHARAAGSRAASLKAYAQAHMEALGLDRVQGDVVGLRLQKGAPSVEMVDESLIPSNFIMGSITKPLNELPEELQTEALRSVNRKAILEAHKDGRSVPGTEVVQKKHLRIV